MDKQECKLKCEILFKKKNKLKLITQCGRRENETKL